LGANEATRASSDPLVAAKTMYPRHSDFRERQRRAKADRRWWG
jgi:hypothetical protein